MPNREDFVLDKSYEPGVYPDAACSVWVNVTQGAIEVAYQVDGNYEEFILRQGGAWRLGDARFGLEVVRFTPIAGSAIIDFSVGRDAGEFIPAVNLASPPVHQGPIHDERSGTIAKANTSQTLVFSNLARRYLTIENLESATALWIRYGDDPAEVSTPGSVRLGPYDFAILEAGFIATNAVQGISTKAGHKFTVLEG